MSSAQVSAQLAIATWAGHRMGWGAPGGGFSWRTIERYWMKPNVNGVVPLPSLELRFEDVWLA